MKRNEEDSSALHILVLFTRKDEDVFSVQTYVNQAFPAARRTCLIPDAFVETICPEGKREDVFPYFEGPGDTWTRRLRMFLNIRQRHYHYCICPFRRDDASRYYRFLYLLLVLRPTSILLYDLETKPKKYRKTEIFKLYVRCRWQELLAWCTPRVREAYYHIDEHWIGERLDPFAWFLLAFAARIVRGFPGWASGTRRRKGSIGRMDEQRVRIAHFVSSLEMGGTQRQLLTFLPKAKCVFPRMDLFVYTNLKGAYEERFEAQGVGYTRIRPRTDGDNIPPTVQFFWRHFPNTLSALRLCSLLKRRGGYQIVHNWEFTANVVGSVAAALARTPVIVSSIRNMSYWKKAWYAKWWYHPADRLTAGLNTRIIANAEAVRKDYAGWAGIPAHAVRTIHNGLDPESVPGKDEERIEVLKREMGWKKTTRVVGWVGRVAPEKNPTLFMEVVSRLAPRSPDLRFVVLGDGVLLEEMRKRCRVKGLENRVRFLGGRQDAYTWMQMFDVLVATSVIEGMPNVLIEAQLMGIPCVTTRAGGAGEVIKDGDTGFVVSPDDVSDLVEKTDLLLRDASVRNHFGKAGRERALDLFNAKRMVRETLLLYREFMGSAGTAR